MTFAVELAYWQQTILRTIGVLLAVLAARGHVRLRVPVQDGQLHAEPARPDGGRPVRLAAVVRRGRQVHPEGGHRPRRGRQAALQAGALHHRRVGAADVRRRAVRARRRLRQHRRRHLLRARGVVDLGDRHPHRRLGVGQQVLAARRPARRGPAHRLRAAAGARGGRCRHPGGHAEPAGDRRRRRPTDRSSDGTPSATRTSSRSSSVCSSSSSRHRPSSRRRRSTCRSPSPSSSPAT